MKAIVGPQPDGAEELAVVERQVPRPGPGEVLIKVAAAGVNRPDILQRRGLYPPPPGAPDIMRGSLGAARSDQSVDSANSQFFITFGPNAMLDHHYTVYGRVIQGMDVVDKIAPGEPPADPTKIVHAKIGN